MQPGSTRRARPELQSSHYLVPDLHRYYSGLARKEQDKILIYIYICGSLRSFVIATVVVLNCNPVRIFSFFFFFFPSTDDVPAELPFRVDLLCFIVSLSVAVYIRLCCVVLLVC